MQVENKAIKLSNSPDTMGLCTIELDEDDVSQCAVIKRELLEDALSFYKTLGHRYISIRVQSDGLVFISDNSKYPARKIGVGIAPYTKGVMDE